MRFVWVCQAPVMLCLLLLYARALPSLQQSKPKQSFKGELVAQRNGQVYEPVRFVITVDNSQLIAVDDPAQLPWPSYLSDNPPLSIKNVPLSSFSFRTVRICTTTIAHKRLGPARA
jgi:hypothetical protein